MAEPDAPPASWQDPLVDLYRDNYDRMVRLAYLLSRDAGAAEEIVQESFIAMHGSWERAREPAAYLRTTVTNRARSWGRRKSLERRRAASSPALRVVPEVPDPLWDILHRLRPRQRAAIVLRFYEDMAEADIAELLGCRPATVRTAIHRGLTTMRRELDG